MLKIILNIIICVTVGLNTVMSQKEMKSIIGSRSQNEVLLSILDDSYFLTEE